MRGKTVKNHKSPGRDLKNIFLPNKKYFSVVRGANGNFLAQGLEDLFLTPPPIHIPLFIRVSLGLVLQIFFYSWIHSELFCCIGVLILAFVSWLVNWASLGPKRVSGLMVVLRSPAFLDVLGLRVRWLKLVLGRGWVRLVFPSDFISPVLTAMWYFFMG